MAHQAEFERRWLARQDAPMWSLDQVVLCKQALNPTKLKLVLDSFLLVRMFMMENIHMSAHTTCL